MFKERINEDKEISDVYRAINRRQHTFVLEDRKYRFDKTYVHWFYMKNMLTVMVFFDLVLSLSNWMGYIQSMVLGIAVSFVLWFFFDWLLVSKFLKKHIVLVE